MIEIISTGKGKADLHLHSTASDGRDAPRDVMKRAKELGVITAALTDHDSLGGLDEAADACEKLGMRFIPGVELSAEGDDQVHFLAYGITHRMAGIRQLVNRMRQDRENRETLYLQRLKDLGMPLEEEALVRAPGTAFSRPILARALAARGYAASEQDAFQRLLSPGKPAYVSRLYVPAEEVISTIRSDGAVCVLAHPGLMGCAVQELEEKLRQWADAGLQGLEVHHPGHDEHQRKHLTRFAQNYGLLITSGSDYHGKVDAYHGEIGSQFDDWQTAREDMRAFLAMVN